MNFFVLLLIMCAEQKQYFKIGIENVLNKAENSKQKLNQFWNNEMYSFYSKMYSFEFKTEKKVFRFLQKALKFFVFEWNIIIILHFSKQFRLILAHVKKKQYSFASCKNFKTLLVYLLKIFYNFESCKTFKFLKTSFSCESIFKTNSLDFFLSSLTKNKHNF